MTKREKAIQIEKEKEAVLQVLQNANVPLRPAAVGAYAHMSTSKAAARLNTLWLKDKKVDYCCVGYTKSSAVIFWFIKKECGTLSCNKNRPQYLQMQETLRKYYPTADTMFPLN